MTACSRGNLVTEILRKDCEGHLRKVKRFSVCVCVCVGGGGGTRPSGHFCNLIGCV